MNFLNAIGIQKLKNICRRPVIINEQIPGYKSKQQLQVMGEVIQYASWFSTIVELGSCAGIGTWTLSKNAPPFSKVYAIDWWMGHKNFKGYGFNLDATAVDTQEYFESFVKDCKNITPIQGEAKDIKFSKKVDVLMWDCDWGRNKNNYFPVWDVWKQRLKEGALIMGANYFPDRLDELTFISHVKESLTSFDHQHGIWWGTFSRQKNS